MYSYENPKIRNKRIKRNKRYKLIRKTFAVAGATIVLVSTVSALIIKSGALEPAPQTIISDYYGKSSEEYNIVNYIELSKELEDLNLSKYEMSANMFERYNISNELKKPEEIKKLISDLKNMNAYISSKNIAKQSENIDIVLNLIMQKDLVNDYIYKNGYDIARNNVETELKEYAGEVFGVDGKNLEFYHRFDNKSGDNLISIKNGDKRYNNGVFSNKTEKDIRKGIEALDNIKSSYNTYSDDYNENRNNDILNALKVSAQLSEVNDENDLYNSKMASKLR